MQTVKAARTRMRRITYQVGGHGKCDSVYTTQAGRGSPRQSRYTTRAGSVGVVHVPWKSPLYWNPDGSRIPDWS